MPENNRMRFSVAPMMDWTDRHCRAFHRQLTRRALLYTEMLTADAVIHGDRHRLLGYDPIEHPVALQLGGSDPAKMREAAAIGAAFGYDEINLNIGCPSDRVQSGRFGACLMLEPDLVASLWSAAKEGAGDVPVTIKSRIGVDEQAPREALFALADACAQAGCTTFIVHARKAWLAGLSPKQNRDIPPLDYDLVHALKRERPALAVVLNGGLRDLDHALAEQGALDGVMLGRVAYQNPAILLEVDPRVFAARAPNPDRAAAVEAYLPYVEAMLARGVPLHAMTRHMLGLFNGLPGGRRWRRTLSERAVKPNAGVEVIQDALGAVGVDPALSAATVLA
ncbi:MAG: tRNA dihydrouridine(20/20a) synthase DusA [Hyphomonadaceae bacterium]|nr:tRNA dihydrouridine(20/20a) synthase DusA [Hyphomonadaceae bacterium]